MTRKYGLGLIVGKFYPFHKGHQHLIEVGLKRSEHLIVMVVSNREKERISAELRASWISATFPALDVRVIDDIGYDDDSRRWADYTVRLLGRTPDVVITSEKYGVTWAEELSCEHIQVDEPRVTFPISGTIVRSDPLASWDMLPKATRGYFTQKIVLIGAESTGKSTLAEMLARHYHTNWVHEYGRFYTELRRHNSQTKDSKEHGIDIPWVESDFVHIATTQTLMENQLSESANKLLICDTDAFATHIWHYRYSHKWSRTVLAIANTSHPLLYLVTPPDIPFEQDGTRDGEHIRRQMHSWVIDALERHNRPYHIVKGGIDIDARLEDAIHVIEEAQGKWKKEQLWGTHTTASEQ